MQKALRHVRQRAEFLNRNVMFNKTHPSTGRRKISMYGWKNLFIGKKTHNMQDDKKVVFFNRQKWKLKLIVETVCLTKKSEMWWASKDLSFQFDKKKIYKPELTGVTFLCMENTNMHSFSFLLLVFLSFQPLVSFPRISLARLGSLSLRPMA